VQANQLYFHRNQGSWNWRVRFELVSWARLWRANISLFSKISLSLLVIVQRCFGEFKMWTDVDVAGLPNVVRHSTTMKKWGLTVYRSEKKFTLHENGTGIQLEGREYFWPLSFIGIPFPATHGSVDTGTPTRAIYQMPMAGTQCECRAFLEMPEGHINISSPFLTGRFSLTSESNEILRSRLK
jgi:hypothetical protein